MQDANAIPEVARLDRLAVHSITPCGASDSMVWRRWGNGPPAVLLHGGSGSWTHWLRNIDTLARHHTLWVPDLPGCGDSGLPPGAYDADSIFEHVASGIAQVAAGQPVDLIGFSFGSLVAGFLAAHHPELIKRLVLVAPPSLGIRMPAVDLQSMSRAMTPEEHQAATRHNLQSMMLHQAASIDDLAVATHAANFARDRLRRRRISRTDIMARLKLRWQCPVYVICGREDVLARHELQRLPELLDQCDFRGLRLIDQAGHWVQYEQPDAFHEAIAAFLR